MALFVVSARTPLSPAAAWAQLTDWPAHAKFVPLTHIEVTTPGPNGVGTTFVARTAVGRVGFDDPMTIEAWEPPGTDGRGRCRLVKGGRVMLGWAELTVSPTSGGGAEARWQEDIRVARLPRLADRPTAATSRLLFGRVLRQLVQPPH